MTPLVAGEGVPLELERAGLGSRIVATLLDLVVQVVALIALVAFDAFVIAGSDSAAAAALAVVEILLVLVGYPILFEWLSHGRTLGKMAMGLRVVRDDGGPIGLRHAVVRGLASGLLEKPGLIAPLGTAAGLLTVIFNPGSKRIGDLMAGTFVVNERAGPGSALSAAAFTIPWSLQGWAAALDLSRVDDGLALAVRQFVLRAPGFTPAAQEALGAQLRGRLGAVLAPPPPADLPTAVLLSVILAERRRRAETVVADAGPRAAHAYPTAPYPTGPYPTAPYPTGPYPTAPYPTAPYPTGPYPTAPYPTAPYSTAPDAATPPGPTPPAGFAPPG